MIYRDRIYGKVKIEAPIILELIKSPSLQRLKGIDQAGYLPLLSRLLGFPYLKVKHNRFEHSLGVFILLKKFNAPLEEQIAGLIHDVSHPVFSHCIDYALDEGSEIAHTYQDNIFEKFVKNSEIPKILNKYRLDVAYILNKNNFPLLERELPDLCADRLDYSLRTAFIFREADRKKIDYLLNNLIIENNFWIFKNLKVAKIYAQLFFKMNTIYYAGFPSAIMFRTTGDVIRYTLQKRYLKREDLFKTDKEIIAKIKKYLNDKTLKLFFKRMQGRVKFKNNPQNYDVHVFCKSRIVDPLFKVGNNVKRLSEADKKWAKIVKEESKPKEYFIKFEK